MEFPTGYSSAMDREYVANVTSDVSPAANIEEPIIPTSGIGSTVPEGARFGSFIQTAQAAIRKGAATIELSTGMGGGQEPAGAESYGKDAREALREIARANEVQLVSVHTPVQIGNMSGFNPQQGNFNDEHRHMEVEEVKKAIKFAAEAAQGGAVVVHTGEFHRTMFDAEWNKKGLFQGYPEEEERAVKPLVDTRTGRVISEVRMNQRVPQAQWMRADHDYVDSKGNHVRSGDYIDYDDNKIDRKERLPVFKDGKPVIETRRFSDFIEEAEEINKELEKEHGGPLPPEKQVTPEEAFLRATTETQERIAKGYALHYGHGIDDHMKDLKKLREALDYFEKVEKEVPEEELWRLQKKAEDVIPGLVPSDETRLPSERIKRAIKQYETRVEESRQLMIGQLQSAKEQELLRENAVSAWKYAKEKATDSYVEAGLYAMEQSLNNPHANRDIFVAPENIFPEMGYGSHPDELIELVKNSRKAMAKKLVDDYGYDEEKAKNMSKRFLKATFDTQHLGMWWKHFKKKHEKESYEERKERFDKWYMEQVDKMQDADIIGNIHLVDSMGGGHHHLPAGQGDMPVVEAIKRLKKKGYKGIINSEAHEEESRFGQGRMLVETWQAFGSPLFKRGGGYFGGTGPAMPRTWGEVDNAYFGRTYPPKFIFGAYSPSNDFRLWSEVPME